MLEMARRSPTDRRDIFDAASQAMRVHPAIVEKDFWVCWILDYLFHDSPWKTRMAFKGGTSLSKAYGAIERFSEDIDLILEWQLLGYTADEPWEKRSNTQLDAFGKEANQRAAEFLAQKFAPALGQALTERAATAVEVVAKEQDVLIRYPRAFALDAILPQVRLEIGPLAAWVPNEDKEIRPYAAERFPRYFTHPATTVRTIVAERTFWEKATILHREAHRKPGGKLPPERMARHYYDFCRLSRLPVRDAALGRLDLLKDVVQFKMRFYRCPWAKYEEAAPGTMRLLPPAAHLPDLRRDYQATRAMLFGTVPTFDEIVEELTALEQAINKLQGDAQ